MRPASPRVAASPKPNGGKSPTSESTPQRSGGDAPLIKLSPRSGTKENSSPKTAAAGAQPPGQDKFTAILSYLDSVEQHQSTWRLNEPVPGCDIDALEVGASQSVSDRESIFAETVVTGMRQKIDTLQGGLAERQALVQQLQARLEEQQAKEEARVRKHKEAAKQALERQKVEYEAVAQRNMTFINALLADKELLSKRVEGLSSELKVVEQRHQQKLQQLEEQQTAALSQHKAQCSAQEKRLRQQWIQEQTKKIKESTLKALEPDITQMLNKHRAEKRQLEEEKQAEIQRREQQLEMRAAEVVELRARANREIEDSLLRQREMLHQQLQEQAARYERQIEEHRRMAAKDKEFLERALEDERTRNLQERVGLEAKVAEARNKEQEALRRFDTELAAEKARLRLEKASEVVTAQDLIRQDQEALLMELQAQHRLALEEEFRQKESDMRQHLIRQRDEQIGQVIAKLEEAAIEQQDLARAGEKKWQERYATLQRERDDLLRQNEELRNTVVALTAQMHQRARQCEAAVQEADTLRHQLRCEVEQLEGRGSAQLREAEERWAAKLHNRVQEYTAALDQQAALVLSLQQQIDCSKREYAEQTAKAKAQKEAQFSELELRVQQALEKKETTIRDLTAALQRSEARNRQIDAVLAKQAEVVGQYDP